MLRFVVLPLGIESSARSSDHTLGRPLAIELARRLRVTGAVDVEVVDPLLDQQTGASYLYTRRLATEVSPALIAKLELDGVFFGEFRSDERECSLDLWLVDLAGRLAFHWHDSAEVDELRALLSAGCAALEAITGHEPSVREVERANTLGTVSLEALRHYGLALSIAAPGLPHFAQQKTLLELAFGLDPDYLDAVIFLVELSLRVGLDAAEGPAGRALEALRTYQSLHVDCALSRVFESVVQPDPQLAVEAATAALALDPYSLAAHRANNLALLALRRPEEAEFAAREGLWRFPEDRVLQTCLAEALLRRGELEEASTRLAALFAVGGDTADRLTLQAELKLAQGCIEESLELRRRALQLAERRRGGWPDGAPAPFEGNVERPNPEASRCRVELALQLIAAGHLGSAAALLVEASAPTQALRSQLAAVLAAASLLIGEDTLAESLIEELASGSLLDGVETASTVLLMVTTADRIREGAGFAQEQATLSELERSHWAIMDSIEADSLESALALFSPQREWRRLIWTFLLAFQRRELERAERVLAVLMELGTAGEAAVVHAARIRFLRGDSERALEWLTQIVRGDVSFATLESVVFLLWEMGRFDTARALLEALLLEAEDPSELGARWALLGWVCARQGDDARFADALDVLLRGCAQPARCARVVRSALELRPSLRAMAASLAGRKGTLAGSAWSFAFQLSLSSDGLEDIDFPESLEPGVERDHVEGEHHLRRGDSNRAVECWRRGLAKEPSHLESALSLARTVPAVPVLEAARVIELVVDHHWASLRTPLDVRSLFALLFHAFRGV